MDLAGLLLGANGGGAPWSSATASSTPSITFGGLNVTSSGGSSMLPWLIAGVGGVLLLFFYLARR